RGARGEEQGREGERRDGEQGPRGGAAQELGRRDRDEDRGAERRSARGADEGRVVVRQATQHRGARATMGGAVLTLRRTRGTTPRSGLRPSRGWSEGGSRRPPPGSRRRRRWPVRPRAAWGAGASPPCGRGSARGSRSCA